MKTTIKSGKYAGQSCELLKIHELQGFAEVVMLDKAGKRTKQHDLVPLSYLTVVIADPSRLASTLSANGSNGKR